jgi:hypothetical protein
MEVKRRVHDRKLAAVFALGLASLSFLCRLHVVWPISIFSFVSGKRFRLLGGLTPKENLCRSFTPSPPTLSRSCWITLTTNQRLRHFSATSRGGVEERELCSDFHAELRSRLAIRQWPSIPERFLGCSAGRGFGMAGQRNYNLPRRRNSLNQRAR